MTINLDDMDWIQTDCTCDCGCTAMAEVLTEEQRKNCQCTDCHYNHR